MHRRDSDNRKDMSMRASIKQLAATHLVQSLLYNLIRAYSRTFRFMVRNEHAWLNYYLKNNGTVLLCTYHQQFFPAINYFKKYQVYHPALMISKSRDGEIVASVAERTGWYPFRGSSSKGGGKALKLMIEHLKKYRLVGHIVDGPRGPAGKVKAGTIRLAHAAHAVIVPFYVAADRAWYFNSWDRFLLPKPFANVVLQFGDIIKFNAVEDQYEFERQRESLENIMYQESTRLKNSFK
jgi:lysophospholipid acyltransferase (LPLAT)-like uncharacterized protein